MESDMSPLFEPSAQPQQEHIHHEADEQTADDDNKMESSSPIEHEPQYMWHPPPPHAMHPQMFPMEPMSKKDDFLNDISKTTWIVIFISFILGFFMGKTMQPVILRGIN